MTRFKLRSLESLSTVSERDLKNLKKVSIGPFWDSNTLHPGVRYLHETIQDTE